MVFKIDIGKFVNENTVKFGIGEIEGISSIIVQKQLVQIEEYLQEFIKKQKQLSKQIKEYSKLSKSSVSKGANVPRSQININPNTLKIYIENRIKEIEKQDNLNIKMNERLKNSKRDLETNLNGLRQQIVDIYELKLELEMLESANKRLILLMESRQKEIQKLEEENSKLRKILSEKSPKKILPLA